MAMRKREATAWRTVEAKEEEVYYLMFRVLELEGKLDADGKPVDGALYELLTEMAEGVAANKAADVA